MKKKVICYLLALGMLGSSMTANAGSLPDENHTAEADEALPEESEEELPEESGEKYAKENQEEELLGAAVETQGGDVFESAKEISLDTEYASNKRGCWYKFTTKTEPAYYDLEIKGTNIALYDGRDSKVSMTTHYGRNFAKLEPDSTYYLYAGTDGGDSYYYFQVYALLDPEGDTAEEAYPLPADEIYRTSLAVIRDFDYYIIRTGQAGYYRFAIGNETVPSPGPHMIVYNQYLTELEVSDNSGNIRLPLEADTEYYILAKNASWTWGGGGPGKYNIQWEYLTDNEGDTMETARSLREGDVYEGDLCAGKDEDFYRLTPGHSGTYVIDISNTSKSGRKDYKIYTELGEVLKSGYVYSERKTSVELELTAGSVYYLDVHGNNYDGNIGKYLVSYGRTFPFSDVAQESGWKYDSIRYVYDNDIMNGINGTTRFAPDEPLTRAMFATVLYRMAGEPFVQFRNIFEDVPAGTWYSNAVVWAYDTGIVQGVSRTRYGTSENITREQIAKMLMEFGDKVGHYEMNEKANLDSFPDRSDVSGWATGYMQWAVGSGIISGSSVGGVNYLDPRGNATRAQCAAMLTRFCRQYE